MIETRICPAKINLFLVITARRADGYHELCSLMVPIGLCDTLIMDYEATDIRVVCDHPAVPEDESNLIHRAARLFFDRLESRRGDARCGLCVRLEKKIPPGGGLGGGSSNAAQTLRGLNRHHGRPFLPAELEAMGLALGADVPFFLQGQAALATGVGERLSPFSNLPRTHLILCSPGIAASTALVYKNLDLGLTKDSENYINTGLNMLRKSKTVDLALLRNDLETSAFKLYPQIRQIRDRMAKLLRRPVRMTGSGACLFAVYENRENARKGVDLLREHGDRDGLTVFLTSFGQ